MLKLGKKPATEDPRDLLFECVTWGRLQSMTLRFYKNYCDEAYAILSPEMLIEGKSLEGFDLAQLQADLKLL